jgi:hypothetical protein
MKVTRWVESERKFVDETSFDRNGKIVANRNGGLFGEGYSSGGKCQPKYTYDEKGRIKEHVTVCGETETIDRKYSYEDDSLGNWIKQTAYFLDEITYDFLPRVVDYRAIEYFD